MTAIGRSGRPTDAQKSGPYPPVPIPSTNRPREISPTVAACQASASGPHIRAAGTTDIPVTSGVSCAHAAHTWKASGTPRAGVHTLSKPRRAASRPACRSPSNPRPSLISSPAPIRISRLPSWPGSTAASCHTRRSYSGEVMADQSPRLTSLSPGAGCACKLPLAKLEALFASMGPVSPASGDLLIGAAEGDDAAVLRLDDERALVLTTDFFTPIVDDPGDWGRIAAANALSDVYAMGGRPLFAVNLAAWPGDGLDVAILGQVLQGGAQVAAQAGCVIAGGHTIDDPVPKYGLAVVGLADPAKLMTIDRAAPGDQLIVTKPVGTGVIATALKRGSPPPEAVRAAVESMIALNAEASRAALDADVIAATDVTGFGLLGHLHRMLAASGAAATVKATAVPLLPSALDLAAAGFVSGGTRANTDRVSPFVTMDPAVPGALSVLLYDAQTSGGLLLATPAVRTTALLADLQA